MPPGAECARFRGACASAVCAPRSGTVRAQATGTKVPMEADCQPLPLRLPSSAPHESSRLSPINARYLTRRRVRGRPVRVHLVLKQLAAVHQFPAQGQDLLVLKAVAATHEAAPAVAVGDCAGVFL